MSVREWNCNIKDAPEDVIIEVCFTCNTFGDSYFYKGKFMLDGFYINGEHQINEGAYTAERWRYAKYE